MAVLKVKAGPRASRRKVEVMPDGTVKVFVTEAPVDGQANDAILRGLADALGLKPGRLKIIRGQASRQKWVEVDGLTDAEALARLVPPDGG